MYGIFSKSQTYSYAQNQSWVCHVLNPFMVGVPKKKKGLKDFFKLFFENNIYMKQT
jgi:uncharacterized membrane protein